MAIQLKKQIHDLIDSIPEDKLPRLFELFLNLSEEEKEELSKAEIEEIRQAKKFIEKQDHPPERDCFRPFWRLVKIHSKLAMSKN